MSDHDDTDEFGEVRFAEDDDAVISIDDGKTEALPHWTEPATGEVPRFLNDDESDGTDPWRAYADETPTTARRRPPVDLTGGASARRGEPSMPPPIQRPKGEGRLSIGTDPTGEQRRPMRPGDPSGATGRTGQVTRDRSRPVRRPSRKPAGGGRDLPTAIAVGLLIAAAFIAASMWRPVAVLAIVVVAVALASIEFFDKVTSSGYKPMTPVGVAACISAPLVAYWLGDAALPLVFAFAFLATVMLLVGSDGIDSGPLPNTAITMMPVMWIGLLGSYAALTLRLSNLGEGFGDVGTDTFFLVVLGVIAHDIGGYAVGSVAGRTPLREWISPNKTLEGLVGGIVATFAAVLVAGSFSDTWTSTGHLVILALAIAVFAPIGDLAESMYKRNLKVKDFGSLIAGHGGALDRFDGLLFSLPVAYYLTLVLQPWA